ncbi:MAG: glycosyltransferase [Patescibacteria group bacterium]
MQVNLSYLTATKNKLSYLKRGLEKVIAEKKSDEEILIADGGSTDGTKEYLESLKAQGKIDYFISEPDFGESHALNKLFLIAKGILIKIINDDDAYYFPTIEACKKFMLEHSQIDILGMEGGSIKHKSPSELYICPLTDCTKDYLKWKKDHTPFQYPVLGIMLRRSSLPLLGFWNLTFTMADTEYTFRVTAGKANVGWYTGSSYVYIKNQDGVTWVRKNRVENEIARLRKFYLNEDPESFIIKKLKALKRKILNISSSGKKDTDYDSLGKWSELASMSDDWLLQRSEIEKPEFLFSK